MANTASLLLSGPSGQYLFRGNDSVLQNLVSALTIEAWVKLPAGDNLDGGIFARFKNSDGNRHVLLNTVLSGGIVGLQFTYQLSNQTVPFVLGFGTEATKLNDGKWHHVAATFVNSGVSGGPEVYIYRDGQVLNSAIASGAPVNLSSVAVNASVNTHYQSDGSLYPTATLQIDDLRVWSVARTQAQIQANYQRELGGNEAGLVGYWRFNGSYTDKTTNGLNWSISGLPVFSTDVPFADATTTSTSTTTTSTSTSSTSTSTSTTTTSTSTSTTTTSTSTSTTTTLTSTSTTRTTTSTSTTTSTTTTLTSTSSTTTTSTSSSTSITIPLRFMVEKVR